MKNEIHLINNIISSYEVYNMLNEYKGEIHNLAGVLLIVDDKILLVKPLKYKDEKFKWSIPKGRIEYGENDYNTALKELYEETGIKLNSLSNKKELIYSKNNTIKKISIYIEHITESELELYTKKKKFDILNFNSEEIYKIKLFTFNEALLKIEKEQLPILNLLYEKNMLNI